MVLATRASSQSPYLRPVPAATKPAILIWSHWQLRPRLALRTYGRLTAFKYIRCPPEIKKKSIDICRSCSKTKVDVYATQYILSDVVKSSDGQISNQTSVPYLESNLKPPLPNHKSFLPKSTMTSYQITILIIFKIQKVKNFCSMKTQSVKL